MIIFRHRIEHDDDAESPREWDNLGTMACWHRRYNLGDEQPSHDPLEYRAYLAGVDKDEFDAYWENAGYRMLRKTMDYQSACQVIADKWSEKVNDTFHKKFISLPLYLYDHSGISMNTGGFSCSWDSGQVGFIYVSLDDVRKEYGWKNVTKAAAMK